MADYQMGPWGLEPLVTWQELCVRQWADTRKPDFLVAAWPGAGKTILALKIARNELEDDGVQRVVVCVNTDPCAPSGSTRPDARACV